MLRPGVDRAHPVLADQIEREALDRLPVELEPGRDDEEVIGHPGAAGGRHRPRLGVDLGRGLLDPGDARGQPLAGGRDRIGRGLQPGRDQGEARLVELFAARVDHRDLGAVEPADQPVDQRDPGRTGPDDHDPRAGPDPLGAPGPGQRGQRQRAPGQPENRAPCRPLHPWHSIHPHRLLRLHSICRM